MKVPSPFDWSSSPSLLAAELAPLKTGLTRSQTATQAVARKEKREGKSPGSMRGISHKADEQIRKGRAS
jgi:hypothetical protein